MTGNAGSIGPTPQTVNIVAKAKVFIETTPGFSKTVQGPLSPKDLNTFNTLVKQYQESFSSGTKNTIPSGVNTQFPFPPQYKSP